jgi:hypothetical protein
VHASRSYCLKATKIFSEDMLLDVLVDPGIFLGLAYLAQRVSSHTELTKVASTPDKKLQTRSGLLWWFRDGIEWRLRLL